ncbi:HPF/RaiA family ribosome-associated protein [soil metagenome]
MTIQVNTDHNMSGSEKLHNYVQSTVEAGLGRFTQLTRVEVHLSDDNGAKSHGQDKRCLLEARPAGMQPVVVTNVAGTLDDSIEGAIVKMAKLLDHTFDKLHSTKGKTSIGEDASDSRRIEIP